MIKMTEIAIHIENVSKYYRMGVLDRHSLGADLKIFYRNKVLRQSLETIYDQEKDIEHIWALRNINLDVEKGSVIGIIGQNGAGKSTLLKILSRLTAPTSGWIYMKGRFAALLEVGTGFNLELTGRENVYVNGAILGMTIKEIDRKFDEIVDFSGVEDFIDTPVKRYSSGMRVRLGFAVAAYLEPEILLVDEVLAVGDVKFQEKCIGKISEVSSQGRTVFFVSHNMASIQKLTNRCVLLENGKLIEDGTTTEVIQTYLKSQIGSVGEGVVFHSANRFFEIHGFRMIKELFKPGFNQPLTFELDLEWIKPSNILFFETSVQNSLNVTLVTAYRQILDFPNKRNRFKILIKNHRLACGDYSVTLKLGVRGYSGNYPGAERFSIPIIGFDETWMIRYMDKLGMIADVEIMPLEK